MQKLISNNADVNAKTNHDLTPLHYAAMYSGTVPKVKILVENNAEVNAKTEHGSTPLDFTALFRK